MSRMMLPLKSLLFFSLRTTTPIYTLSLHDALPISRGTRSSPWTRSGSRPRRGWRGLPAPATRRRASASADRSEEHTSELQSHSDLVCRLLLEKKNIEHAGAFEGVYVLADDDVGLAL